MKRALAIILCVSSGLFILGCQNAKSRAGEGAVIGGVLGAAAGGIIGHQGGHGAEGAAIGAAAGVLTGALVGAQIPKEPSGAQANQAQAAANNPNQMTIQQISGLSKQGIHEDVIIDKIRMSNSKFNLTSDDITYLKQQAVTQKVIDAMQAK